MMYVCLQVFLILIDQMVHIKFPYHYIIFSYLMEYYGFSCVIIVTLCVQCRSEVFVLFILDTPLLLFPPFGLDNYYLF